MDVAKFTQALTPEIIDSFKLAIEIGKWPDGKTLTSAQLETCMQAVIAYEHQHLAKEERTGYVPPKETPCEPDAGEKPLKWEE